MPRWNLGWPTPNYAGAFWATCLALMFVFSLSRWRWAGLAVEAGGLFLLAKTYSRGAVVAWMAAWLFGVVAVRGWANRTQCLLWTARAGVFAALLLATGFEWSRAAGGPAKGEGAGREDGSVVNRIALWRGGLEMVASAPWRGWGGGESGRAYMNWFQDLDRTEGYATMVNSYLHVAVEHGLPILGAVLCGLSWLMMLARNLAPAEGASRLALGAGSSLVAWAVANVFTTLWIEPLLWIVPGIASALLVWHGSRIARNRVARAALASAVIAVVAVLGLYGIGSWLARNRVLDVRPQSARAIAALKRAPGRAVGKIWHVWADTRVLGPTPGKELRRWLETQAPGMQLIVHQAKQPQLQGRANCEAGMMLFGRQVERWGTQPLPDCREVWLIHPLTPPPPSSSANNSSAVTVILPAIDETGTGSAWRAWAKRTGARVFESPSSGLDIRAVWPSTMQVADIQ